MVCALVVLGPDALESIICREGSCGPGRQPATYFSEGEERWSTSLGLIFKQLRT